MLAVALASLALVPVASQGSDGRWTVPRTPDGRPDLQGTWSNATITPVERPARFTSLVLTEAEVARLEKAVTDRIERLAQPSDPNREAPPKGGDGSTGAAGNVGGYNNFWIDSGTRVAVVNGEPRSSLVVDPPNGKVPALTPEARTRVADRMAAFRARGEYDHPEYRPLAERCLLSFGSSAGPPMLPNYFYNNNYQIVQTPDHILILVEMVHDARIIRMNAKEHLPKHIRPWMGDSIGRWEGDTLVVETTNFHPLQTFRGASDTLRVIERFTRADADTILYRFTIDDPTTFTASWSGEVPFEATSEPIYEYACHEGNYALSNVLSGERDREARSRSKTQKEK
ncbi:MAG: hypothetical protein ACRD26_20940 [Vicinamibacterales bacterium]